MIKQNIFIANQQYEMHTKVIRNITKLKEELETLLETHTDKVLDSTKSEKLQGDIQRDVLNYMSDTIDEITNLLESIDDGDYDEDVELDEEYD